jgi:hypothetical protein
MAGAPTLISFLHPFQPACFARGKNAMIAINGIDRGWRWDGITDSAEQLGITPPEAAPTVTTPTGGGATAGSYLMAFRYLDDELPTQIPSNLSPTTTETALSSDKFDWLIDTTTQEARVYWVELYRATSGQATTLYLVLKHRAKGTVVSSASDGGGSPKVRLTLPQGHGLIVGSKLTIAGHSVAGYNVTHQVTAFTATTADTNAAYTAPGTGGTWTFAGYANDTANDNTLNAQTSTALPILNPNGSLNANRFELPPNFKAVCAWFQDRMFYAVDVIYDQGQITLTNGSAVATTTDGGWKDGLAGRYLYITGEDKAYVISAITPGTYPAASLTLEEIWDGTTGTFDYAIRPAPDERNLMYYSEPDEPESVPSINVVEPQENTGDDDEVVGLLPLGGYLMILKSHHIYRLSFNKQPTIDASITLAASRGSISNRTYAIVEGAAFIMDSQGIFRWDGAKAEPVDAVQSLFRDGLIDFDYKKFFYCSKDVEKNLVRFHVQFTSSTSYPGLIYDSIVINYRTGAVWLDYTPFPVGSSCVVDQGRQRPIVGSVGEQVYYQGSGLGDGVETPITGQVISATTTRITKAAGTPFPASLVNAALGITSGPAKGQIARILAVSLDGDSLSFDPAFTVAPTAGSEFRVGAIQWKYKTGLMAVAQRDESDSKRSISLTYQPSADALALDIRVYVNHEDSPRNRGQGPSTGVLGVVSVPGQPDSVIDLYVSRSPLSTAVGYAYLPLNSFYDDRTISGDRWIAFEVRGMGSDDDFEIYEIGVEGLL